MEHGSQNHQQHLASYMVFQYGWPLINTFISSSVNRIERWKHYSIQAMALWVDGWMYGIYCIALLTEFDEILQWITIKISVGTLVQQHTVFLYGWTDDSLSVCWEIIDSQHSDVMTTLAYIGCWTRKLLTWNWIVGTNNTNMGYAFLSSCILDIH